MKRINIEVIVGLFFIVGMLAFAYLTIMLGGKSILSSDNYELTARFTSSAGLQIGAPIEIAGVPIGKITAIKFDPKSYQSIVTLSLQPDVKVQEDAIASVRSTGLIGGKILQISPGGAEEILKPGDEIEETEPSISLEELISKYIFDNKG
jgi:phospholipid/cholesterol/gamma-HCH transport system substrate-binding protein